MQLANLESREVLLAKLAGAMKGSLAKAARIFDALRIKLESEQGTPAVVAEAAPAVEAVVEAPAAEAVAPEVVAEVAEVPAAEATEASTETEEKE
jgi:large subunit ribosomal protein L10